MTTDTPPPGQDHPRSSQAALTSLQALGWRHFLQQQLSLEELEHCRPARVVAQHRSVLLLATESGQISIPPPLAGDRPVAITAGDWLLLDGQDRFVRLLERFSLLARKAAGTRVDRQLIAANLDTLFIVTSLNQELKLNRIERYLVLAHEAGVEPVIVLTKPDLCTSQDAVAEQQAAVQALDAMLMVVVANGLDRASLAVLTPWTGPGRTLGFVGSSGVGKSTLVNLLLDRQEMATQTIREDDGKGRHTTTARSLHAIPARGDVGGGWVLDTPGMRELQIAQAESGIAATFADIAELAEHCRFNDCRHLDEPGCQVRAAVEQGELEPRRLDSYRKLLREEARNSASLAERREQDRALGKLYRSVQNEKRRDKNR